MGVVMVGMMMIVEMESMLLLRKTAGECGVDRERVKRACGALVKYINEQKAQSMNLLEDVGSWINLFVRYKTIPKTFLKYPLQLDLPKPIWNDEEFRICLIIADTKKGRRVKKAHELLVPNEVSKVLSAMELRTQYHDAELKRQFCDAFDLFLLEDGLKHVASDYLGGKFVRLKKFPSLVKLTRNSDKWLHAVQEVKSRTQMYCNVQGERCIKVGRSSFTLDELAINIEAVVRQLVNREEDGGWDEILQLFVCTGESVRLPIYQCFPDAPIVEIKSKVQTPTSAGDGPEQKKRKRTTQSDRPTKELKTSLVHMMSKEKNSLRS